MRDYSAVRRGGEATGCHVTGKVVQKPCVDQVELNQPSYPSSINSVHPVYRRRHVPKVPIPHTRSHSYSKAMAREQQKDLAEKFVEAQGKWDTSAIEATLASDAKHDLLPASLGVGQKDNAGKLEVTKKMASAHGEKPVNVSHCEIKATCQWIASGSMLMSCGRTDQDPPKHPGRGEAESGSVH